MNTRLPANASVSTGDAFSDHSAVRQVTELHKGTLVSGDMIFAFGATRNRQKMVAAYVTQGCLRWRHGNLNEDWKNAEP